MPARRTIRPAAVLAIAIAATLTAGSALSTRAAETPRREEALVVGQWFVLELAGVIGQRLAAAGASDPIIESGPEQAGVAAFCAGVGTAHPDAIGLARDLTAEERATCTGNGVTDIRSVPVANDAVVLVTAAGHGLDRLTGSQIHRALAKTLVVEGRPVANPHRRWRDVDAGLPDLPISVAWTRSSAARAFVLDRIMAPACLADAGVQSQPEETRTALCTTLRDDVFLDVAGAGEAQLRQLTGNPGRIGFGSLSYAQLNAPALAAPAIDRARPEGDDLATGRYPLRRVLWFHLKSAHRDLVPGFKVFADEFAPGRALGPDGYLAGMGVSVVR